MTEAGIITYIQLKSVARHVLIQSKVEAVTQYSAGPVLCWVDFVAVTWWNTVPWVWYWAFFFKTALRELGLALFCGMARGMAMLVGYICPDWNISTFAWIAMTVMIPSGWTHLTLVICWPFFSHKHVNIFFSSLLWNISTFYKQDQRNIWLCAKIMNCKDLLYWLFSCSAWGCMRLMLLVQSSSSQLFNGLR